MLLVTACATAQPEQTSAPLPPTESPPPTDTSVPSTQAPNPVARGGELLLLTFDGESCSYEGPTTLKAEPITLQFLNESEGGAAMNLVRHTGDETIQDMLDTFVDGYSEGHHPSWTVEVRGVWRRVNPGKSFTWEGVLEPGIHTLVCARLSPLGVWFGTGLTVEE